MRRLRVDLLVWGQARRKLSGAAVAIIFGVALYFTMFCRYDAIRVLTSPTYGLNDVWRPQFIFANGRPFSLGPIGQIKLAAFFGALKLAVATFCALQILARPRSLAGSKVDSDVLEGGLILVVLISIVSVGPEVLSQCVELVRQDTVQFVLAAVAIALWLVERGFGSSTENASSAVVTELTATPRGAPWYAPMR